MKIALINRNFSLSHGGLERFSVNLATALQKEGHQVHAFAQQAEGLPEGIPVHIIPTIRKPGWRRILGFHRYLRRFLAGESFDVVYGLTRFFPLDIYRLGDGVQRHWLRIRYPFAPWRWLHCLVNPVHLANLYLESRVFRAGNCRRIVTNSNLCKEHAKAYYGVADERIEVIYNGVDHQTFNFPDARKARSRVREKLGLADRDLAIVHVSNNWKRKGLATILRAVRLLGPQGERLHVLVVGRGRPAPFRRLAARLGISDRFHIIGPTERVQDYYGAGDLMVLPTLYDPFSNACLEAMACGLPVITTAGNGAAELIREGENGFVQEKPKDASELARLLQNCLNRAAVMGVVARETSIPFSRDRNMRENLELFRCICQEKSGQGKGDDAGIPPKKAEKRFVSRKAGSGEK